MNLLYLFVSIAIIVSQVKFYLRKRRIRKYIPNKFEWLTLLSLTTWMTKDTIFNSMKNHKGKGLPREVLDDLDDLLDGGYLEIMQDKSSKEILFRLLPKGRMVLMS